MEPILKRLEIEELKSKVALCKIVCAGLEEKYDVEGLSPEVKDEIAKLWAAALIDGNALRAHLEMLEVE